MCACFDLVPDVGVAGGVVSHQYDAQVRSLVTRTNPPLHIRLHLILDLLGDRSPRDDLRPTPGGKIVWIIIKKKLTLMPCMSLKAGYSVLQVCLIIGP